MPQPAPPEKQVPLVVDLDGTVIKTDLLWESLARLLARNPLRIFQVLFWWTHGRAFLKKQLARRVTIDPATLPYNETFLKFLREQKSAGRKIILATASDLQMAMPVANYVGIFDEVLGSDGKTNLRGANKLKALVSKYGERGFDYAGNSAPDLTVWGGCREAIVVNAPQTLVKRAEQCAKIGQVFPEDYSALFPAKNFLNEVFIRSGYLIAIAGGLLLALAFPKPGIAGFAWVAPGIMLAAALGKSGGAAFRVGYVAGLSFWLVSLYWLLLIPATGYPILGWIALSCFLALYQGVWVWLLAGKICRGSWAERNIWALAGAAAWVALEMIRAHVLGGFPWNFIGVSQYQMTPLIQIASVTGVYGVSFLVVWVSLLMFSAVRAIFSKPHSRYAWQPEIFLPLFVVIGLFAWGEIKLSSQNPPTGTVPVTLIQPSIPQSLIWDESQDQRRFQQVLGLSKEALADASTNSHPSQVLIWPESAVPEFDDAAYAAITNLVRSGKVWLIFNADDVVSRPNATNENDNYDYNAAFQLDPDGLFAGVYHKQKLVIFGEYIPLANWLPFVKWFTPITGGYAAGNEPVQFTMIVRPENQPVPETESNATQTVTVSISGAPEIVQASPLICFEDTFPQLARKATHQATDFLVNLTNDGWFGRGAEQWQHMANAVFRAIENGVPLVRCSNNGITCWIDAQGRVRNVFRDNSGSVYGAGAMTLDLPIQKHAQTFYNRRGDWLGWLSVAVFTIMLGFKIARDGVMTG